MSKKKADAMRRLGFVSFIFIVIILTLFLVTEFAIKDFKEFFGFKEGEKDSKTWRSEVKEERALMGPEICSNGIKDASEAGIDCGGSCRNEGKFCSIWLSIEEVRALPNSSEAGCDSGCRSAWNNLISEANAGSCTPNLENIDETCNVRVLAQGIACAKLGNSRGYCDDVRSAIEFINGHTYDPIGDAIGLGRNLGAYIVAAELINLSRNYPAIDNSFRAKLREYLYTPAAGGGGVATLNECFEVRPNNWGTQCGSAVLPLQIYLKNVSAVERAVQIFHGWMGAYSLYNDGSSPGFNYGLLWWQNDSNKPVGINHKGDTIQGRNVDGVLPEENRRCGSGFQWPPCKSDYMWEGMQGPLAMGVMLYRQGYDVWNWEDQALLRANKWLYETTFDDSSNFPPQGDDRWLPYIVNYYYGTSYPTDDANADYGKNFGWTSWTHRGSIASPECSENGITYFLEPYVMAMNETTEIIRFETTQLTNASVEYGTTSSYGSSVDDNGKFKHEIRLTDLIPGTRYNYKIRVFNNSGATCNQNSTFSASFLSSDNSKTRFSFAVIGDSRGGTCGQLGGNFTLLINRIANSGVDFVLVSGDDIQAASGGCTAYDSYWQGFHNVVKELRKNTSMLSSPGNHENLGDANSRIAWRNYWIHPLNGNGVVDWWNETTFSWRYGNSVFISVNTLEPGFDGDIGGSQFTWFNLTALNQQATHKFVLTHKPLVGSSRSGNLFQTNPSRSRMIDNEMYKKNVTAAFYGHDHYYCYNTTQNGMLNIISGGGGAPLYSTSTCIGLGIQAYHYIIINVSDNVINATAYDVNGNPIHRFSRVMASVAAVMTSPQISFVNPTPNGAVSGEVVVNVSSSDDYGEHSVILDWNRSLLLWLRMDDRNATAVFDKSSYSNNGSIYRAVYSNSGKLGGVFEFSDNDEPNDHTYIRIRHANPYIPNSLDMVEGKEVSYFAWVKSNKNLNDLGSIWDSYVVFKPKNTFLLGWSGWSRDGWECNVWNQSNANMRVSVWSSRALVKDEWVHLGCVFNGTFLGLYINGNLVSYNNTILGYRLQNNTFGGEEYYDLFIGTKNQYAYNNLTWNGSIDDVQVYNRFLNPGEVRAIYNAEVNQYENKFSNLQGSYSFKAYAQDLGGNLNSTETRSVYVCIDNDGDSWNATGGSCGSVDCNDSNVNVNPGRAEVCNGLDDNCVNNIDENNGYCSGATPYCVSGTCAQCTQSYQCDDGIWCDGDEVCTGNVCSAGAGRNCGDGLSCTIDSCNEASDSCVNTGIDGDGDGFNICAGANYDCDDGNGAIYPNAIEVCDGVDNNCVNGADEGCQCINGQTQVCGSDVGECSKGIQTCSSGVWGVCAGEITPTSEVCNSLDDNCNGENDDGLAFSVYYRDADGDLYGDGNVNVSECSQPNGYVLNNMDCNDNDNKTNLLKSCNYNNVSCGSYMLCVASCYVPPPEICGNGNDEDCNGAAELCSSNLPTLTVTAPLNATYKNKPVPLQFGATGVSNCWYVLDGVKTNSACSVSTTLKPSVGYHDFSVVANNSAGETKVNRRFNVVYTRKYSIRYNNFKIAEGTGVSGAVTAAGARTTDLDDLTDEQLQAITFTLDDGVYGIVEFLEPVNLTAGANADDVIDLDSNVLVSPNKMEIISNVMPALNKKVKVALQGLSFSNPMILRDGYACSDCVIESYSGGNLVFNVTGFSYYTAEETPVSCSDGIQNGDETGVDCGGSCQACTVSNNGNNNGGGGGGGGGGGIRAVAANVSNTSGIKVEGMEKIVLSENLSYLNIGKDKEEKVLFDLYGNSYTISFVLEENGVLARVLNGDYLIQREDVLPIKVGRGEIYVGVVEFSGEGARIVMGLDANAVKQYVGGASAGGDGDTKLGIKNIYFVLFSIVGVLIVVIIVLAIVNFRKKWQEKEAISKFKPFAAGKSGQ